LKPTKINTDMGIPPLGSTIRMQNAKMEIYNHYTRWYLASSK